MNDGRPENSRSAVRAAIERDYAIEIDIQAKLDFFYRVKSTYYTGPQTDSKDFKDNFYKGYYYLGSYGFTAWNMYRPQLKDAAVRKAIQPGVPIASWAVSFCGWALRSAARRGALYRGTNTTPSSFSYQNAFIPRYNLVLTHQITQHERS